MFQAPSTASRESHHGVQLDSQKTKMSVSAVLSDLEYSTSVASSLHLLFDELDGDEVEDEAEFSELLQQPEVN